MDREAIIILSAFAMVVAIMAFVLLRSLWRNLAFVLALAAIGLFVFGWWHEGSITLPYVVCATVLLILSRIVDRLRRPRPMTPERMYSIVEPAVEISSETDRRLLQSLCSDAVLDPDFKDHWYAVEYNPGKRTSRAQREHIREMGYTGKIPGNMRAASALIEVLKIVKRFNAEKSKCGSAAVKLWAVPAPGASPAASRSDIAADFTALWNCATQAGRLSRHDAETLLAVVMRSDNSVQRSALATALGAVMSAPVDNAAVPDDIYSIASEWLESLGR